MSSRRGLRTTPEWVTFGLSLLVLGGVVGVLVAQLLGEDAPARPVAHVLVEEIEQVGDRFAVPVEVTNEGDRGAQGVEVSAEIVVGDTATTAGQTVDFLGASESVTLVFLFDEDPASGDLTASVDGFTVP